MSKNIKVFLLAIIISATITYMADFTWGDLPKSQIDNQLITEAITEAINAHEADPEAHLGDGESLEQHKANEVIDHPQQSVVMDKQAFGFYDEGPQPIGGFGWDPDVGSISGSGTRHIDASLFFQTEVFTTERLPWEEEDGYPDADMLLRFRLSMNGAQNSDGYTRFIMHSQEGYDVLGRMEFVKEGTSYKWLLYYEDTLVHSYTIQNGTAFQKFIAVYFNKTEGKIDLFVAGVLVSSYETADWHDFIFSNITLDMLRTTNTSIEFNITYWGARYTLFTI